MTNEERIDCLISGIIGSPEAVKPFYDMAEELKAEIAELENLERVVADAWRRSYTGELFIDLTFSRNMPKRLKRARDRIIEAAHHGR